MELGMGMGLWFGPKRKAENPLQKYCYRQEQSDQGLYSFMYNSLYIFHHII